MSYFDWIDKHTRPKRRREPEPDKTELAIKPAEPITVEESHASTTIIERFFLVVGKRRG